MCLLNPPILAFTLICSPIFGLIGCLIPAWLVFKVPKLRKYRGFQLIIIIIVGVLLCVSPFLALFTQEEKASPHPHKPSWRHKEEGKPQQQTKPDRADSTGLTDHAKPKN